VNGSDWSDLFACQNVDIAYNMFSDKLTDIFNSNFKLVRASRKSMKNNKPWITASLIRCVNNKSKLYKKWILSKQSADESLYKNYANELRKILNKAEASYFQRICDTKLYSLKKVWSNLNSVISTQFNKKSKPVVNKLIINSRPITDPSEIANEFNDYFCNVGNSLSKLLPPGDFKSYLNNPMLNSFACHSASLSELDNIIQNLNNSKSVSCDNISNFLIKECKNDIILPLLYVINLSLDSGIFPAGLKMTKIIPLYKGGDSTLMSNYRPISLTSPIAKILERVMFNRVSNYLNHYNVLYEYQFGFRKIHSTSLAVIDIVNMIETELSNKNYVLGVFIDFKKAFDCVDIDILLYKLQYYGIRGHVLDWFKSYLTNRNQYTFVNDHVSSTLISKSGVRQGSVLGPLLFLLYINDIYKVAVQGKMRLFADDTNIFIIANDLTVLFNLANDITCNVYQWLISNKLSINFEKSNYMIFKPNNYIINSINNLNLSISINFFCYLERRRQNILVYGLMSN